MSDLNEVARLLRELIQAVRENTEEVRRLRGAQSADCEIGYARVANPNAPDGFTLVPRAAVLREVNRISRRAFRRERRQ